MAIDINKPVKQGSDVVLNYGDGQALGTPKGYNREFRNGKLVGSPPGDNPTGDVNPPDSYENHVINRSEHDSNPDPR
jgi:hypothetical protein